MSPLDASPASLTQVAPPPAELARPPLVLNGRSHGWLADHIASVVEGPAPRWWWIAFGLSSSALLACIAMIVYLVSTGIGVWGLNHPVAWAWDITNFVFWIGIGHAGTLISAILFLLRQGWRSSINRAAEAMTIFAVICAGLFPLIHMGRPWNAWWLLPIPNANSIWPQFRSPLEWDVFAISTYFIVSLLFWYLGLIPDLAALRDRAASRTRQILYGIFALGWRNSHRHWSHYNKTYLVIAGLSTALVVSVHSIVSFDFAVAQLPGWHSTIFPPYFVAGAIFSGFGMVMTLLVPLRSLCHLEDIITLRHVELMCKVTLATGSLVGYAYAAEFFTAWQSGNPYELAMLKFRAFGPYWWAFWIMIVCNVLAPQLFWFSRVRRSLGLVFLLSIAVNVGMWFERFVIVATTLAREFMPANWGCFSPTWVDILTLIGSFGLFLTLFLLFIRFLPMVAMWEVKHTAPPPASPQTKGGPP